MKKYLVFFLLLCLLQFGISAIAEQNSNDEELFDSLMQKGIEQHDKGNYTEAIKYYNKALKIRNDEWALYEIGYSYLKSNLKSKNYTKAQHYFEQSISLNHEFSPPYSQLAFIYSEQKNYAKSNLYYLISYTLDKEKGRPLLNNIGINLIKCDLKKAIKYFQLLLLKFHDDKIVDTLILYTFSQIYEKNKIAFLTLKDIDENEMYKNTIENFEKLLNDPRDLKKYEIYYYLGVVCSLNNNNEKAKEHFSNCKKTANKEYKQYCDEILNKGLTKAKLISDEDFVGRFKELVDLKN